MLYFPQLASGATVQYPFLKQRLQRTISNDLASGDSFKLLDPAWARVAWELTFETLNSEERVRLEEFFVKAGGRLNEFTFLDPTQNLFLRSEELVGSAWTKDPLLALSSGVADPNGGISATRVSNTGSASQRLHQTIQAPGWFCYCFSLYARSEAPTSVVLFRATGGTEETTSRALSANWARLALSGASQSEAESVTFGLGLAPGAAVDIYGLQAEAQPAPSTYRKTTSRCGVCRGARLDDDSLSITSHGPEQHSCTLRIVAPMGS
jgi:hypothetical protein